MNTKNEKLIFRHLANTHRAMARKRAGGKYVFWQASRNDSFSKMFRKATLALNLQDKGYSFHSCRYTFTTLNTNKKDANIFMIKEILGHEEIRTTQIYTNPILDGLLAVDLEEIS